MYDSLILVAPLVYYIISSENRFRRSTIMELHSRLDRMEGHKVGQQGDHFHSLYHD